MESKVINFNQRSHPPLRGYLLWVIASEYKVTGSEQLTWCKQGMVAILFYGHSGYDQMTANNQPKTERHETTIP